MRRGWVLLCVLLGAVALGVPGAGQEPEVRIKDIARLSGVRANQLFGYGLVVGLAGTGDSSGAFFTVQSVANMLNRLGIVVPPSRLRVRNVAAVMVTAELPPFAREGDRLDVILSSIGDARSLVGGVLLQTPLQAADGNVYAVAQGPVAVGGAGESAGGSKAQINHLTVGRVPGGAVVERAVVGSVAENHVVSVVLLQPDFSTAVRVAEAINRGLGRNLATAVDAARVDVNVPPDYPGGLAAFVARVESFRVRPDVSARVVVNERTGTVVIGGAVRILPVVIAHGNLRIEVQSEPQVSQPPPLSRGETRVVPRTRVAVTPEPGALVPIPGTNSVQDLARALNALGVTPRDLIAILQALKAAGALQGELVIQ
jgi:flagellar P-ring protein precursor FlgI